MDTLPPLSDTARYWAALDKTEQDQLKVFDPQMRRSTKIPELRMRARREQSSKRVICATPD